MAVAKKAKKKRRFTKFRLAWWGVQLGLAAVALAFFVNVGLYIYNQPLELLSWVPGNRAKTPDQIWQTYGANFKAHEGGLVTASMLAAIVVVESGGDPFARPQWQFRWSRDITRLYTPASTAFGLMQITKGTMRQAENLCQRDPVNCGSWWSSRANPAHSIALGAQYLKHHSERLARVGTLNPDQQVTLIATTHLCGPGRARRLVQKNFVLTESSYCGTHSLKGYVGRVKRWSRYFDNLESKYVSSY